MVNKFPRKKVYVFITHSPLREGEVFALNDRKIIYSDFFKGYSEGRWDAENKGWTSSIIPSAVDVEYDDTLKIHCGLTEYKYLSGMVKLALARGSTDLVEMISGLSTEIMPLTIDERFFLDRRVEGTTQHAVGFYDIPTAGQNAQIYLDKATMIHPRLIKDIFDMFGFPKWNLIRHLNLRLDEIGNIFYTGFSRGFEVSLDSQFNGYSKVNVESREIMKRNNLENRLVYNFGDLIEVLDSIGNNGKTNKIKEDIYGNIPKSNEQTKGFAIVDDCLGTLLSNLYHLKRMEYNQALEILKSKVYSIKEVKQKLIHLENLN